MNLTRLMLASARAFVVALVLTPIVRDVFRSYNVVDRPGRRKVHAYPIPRVGGVSIMFAYVLGLMALRGSGSVFPAHWLQTILSGAAIIFVIGLIDDFLNLKPTIKLMGQIAAAGVVYASGIQIDSVAGFELPVWLGLSVTIFWLLLTTNALNLIDGLDGLCGGIGFFSALAFFVAALTEGNATLAFSVLPLAGALLGFLFFNFNPATVFLGDSGALLIGFMLGCFGIILSGHRVTAIGAALLLFALCVPMIELGLSIVRRTLDERPIFSADRGHIHHRLLDRGLSVRDAALTLYAAAIAGAIFDLMLGYLWLRYDGAGRAALIAAVLMTALVTAVAGIRLLRYAEFEVAGYFLFQGELRSAFARALRMHRLSISLEHSRDVDHWWELVAAAAAAEKWIGLRWTAGDTVVRESRIARRTPTWTFSFEPEPGESIQIEGDDQAARGSSDLAGLSGILRRSLQSSRREGVRLAL